MAHWKDGKRRWMCPHCNYIVIAETPPKVCPACQDGKGRVWAMPMSEEAPCSKP